MTDYDCVNIILSYQIAIKPQFNIKFLELIYFIQYIISIEKNQNIFY